MGAKYCSKKKKLSDKRKKRRGTNLVQWRQQRDSAGKTQNRGGAHEAEETVFTTHDKVSKNNNLNFNRHEMPAIICACKFVTQGYASLEKKM